MVMKLRPGELVWVHNDMARITIGAPYRDGHWITPSSTDRTDTASAATLATPWHGTSAIAEPTRVPIAPRPSQTATCTT